MKTSQSPKPEDVLAARKSAGITQTQAAALIHSGRRAWQEWESGNRRMHPGLWELFNIKLDKAKVPALSARPVHYGVQGLKISLTLFDCALQYKHQTTQRENEMQALKDTMKQKLSSVGLGYEELTVFGAIRCNVHVKCVSRDTADKWAELLAQVFNGAKVSVTKTMWDAKENKGTCLRPTKRLGFLIAVAA